MEETRLVFHCTLHSVIGEVGLIVVEVAGISSTSAVTAEVAIGQEFAGIVVAIFVARGCAATAIAAAAGAIHAQEMAAFAVRAADWLFGIGVFAAAGGTCVGHGGVAFPSQGSPVYFKITLAPYHLILFTIGAIYDHIACFRSSPQLAHTYNCFFAALR